MGDDEQGEFAWPVHDADSEQAEWEQAEAEPPAQEETSTEQADSGHADSGQADGEQADGEQTDSEQTDSGQAGATQPMPTGVDTSSPAEQTVVQQPVAEQTVITSSVHAVPQRVEPAGDVHPAATAGDTERGATTAQPAPAAAEPASAPPAPTAPTPADTGRPRRRRWPWVAGALLLIVAVGVVLALPPVSNRLALPWAPNAPKAEPPQPSPINRVLHGPQPATGHRPTPAGVAATLNPLVDNPALGTLGGVVIDPATGETLWSHNGNNPMTPASTTKLLTSAAALLALDHDMRIPTKVVSGREPGTVVLVAGGDPTLSSLPTGQKSIYPAAAHLDTLVAEVTRATGGDVERVAIDLGAYSGPVSADSWDPVDVPTYTAAMAPAMLDGGHTDPTANHSSWVQDPAKVLLQEFAQRLGADVADSSTVSAPQGAKVLGTVYSAPIPQLVRRALTLSDDVLAGAIARQVAQSVGLPASFEGASKAVESVLAKHGFDVSGLRLADGSGMSKKNRIPPRLLANVLAVAAAPTQQDPRTAKLRPLLSGLPVAGGTGTLAGRYSEPPSEAGRGWVRAKTGTLSETNTLAGIVLDSQGRVLVFAFMSAGTPATAARPALDSLAAALRGCGCNQSA